MKKEDIYYWEAMGMDGRNSTYQYCGRLTPLSGGLIQHCIFHKGSVNKPKEWFDDFKLNTKKEIEKIIMYNYEASRNNIY